MNYEEMFSCFKRLNTLEKIYRTNGLAPIPTTLDYEKAVTNSVGIGNLSSKMWYNFCDKSNCSIADCRTIAKAKELKYGHSEPE
jgi:hypothetical protein